MRVKRKWIGCIVGIVFLDHVISRGVGAEALLCEVFGKLISVNNLQIVLEHWSVHTGSEASQVSNVEQVAIVQSTILALTPFEAKKAIKFF